MARRISEIARQNGLEPEPAAVTQLEIALDTAHEDSIAPFWSVLLTAARTTKYMTRSSTPPAGSRACGSRAPRTTRLPQRWHFDLWLAPT